MEIIATTAAILLSTVGLASANECRSVWSIEPNAEYDTAYDYATVGLNFVFEFGGSSKAECEVAMAEKRNQEITNEIERLELCLLAEDTGAPRLIKECRADGYLP